MTRPSYKQTVTTTSGLVSKARTTVVPADIRRENLRRYYTPAPQITATETPIVSDAGPACSSTNSGAVAAGWDMSVEEISPEQVAMLRILQDGLLVPPTSGTGAKPKTSSPFDYPPPPHNTASHLTSSVPTGGVDPSGVHTGGHNPCSQSPSNLYSQVPERQAYHETHRQQPNKDATNPVGPDSVQLDQLSAMLLNFERRIDSKFDSFKQSIEHQQDPRANLTSGAYQTSSSAYQTSSHAPQAPKAGNNILRADIASRQVQFSGTPSSHIDYDRLASVMTAQMVARGLISSRSNDNEREEQFPQENEETAWPERDQTSHRGDRSLSHKRSFMDQFNGRQNEAVRPGIVLSEAERTVLEVQGIPRSEFIERDLQAAYNSHPASIPAIPSSQVVMNVGPEQIAEFSGRIEDYCEFKQRFFAFCYNLPVQQRLLILRSKLPMAARNRIAGCIGITSEAFTKAFEALDRAYNRPELLVQKLIVQVNSVLDTSCSNSDDKFAKMIAELRNLHTCTLWIRGKFAPWTVSLQSL